MSKSIYVYCVDHGPYSGTICMECDEERKNSPAFLRARIAHLEALIKDAPHSETCACLGFGDCDCFKSKA